MNMHKVFGGSVEASPDGRLIKADWLFVAVFIDEGGAKAAAHAINCHDELVEALEQAFATLTAEDACNIAPCIGSMNPHEHAAALVQAALAKASGAS